MQPLIAVIIATKNRSEAIEKYALPSIERSSFRDFACIVWDASDDDATKDVIAQERWSFVDYHKAPRSGLTSQRNDAAEYALQAYPALRYVIFIDDDCELSSDALEAVCKTFKDTNSPIVNLPMYPLEGEGNRSCITEFIKRCIGFNRRGATEFLYNYGPLHEQHGVNVDWASGGGMALNVDIFKIDRCFFPEAFQRFGGYALGEDFAYSLFLNKKMNKNIMNSKAGHFLHHAAKGGRPNVKNMASSKWYNFHLLFDAIYDDVKGFRLLWLKIKFKLFMAAAAVKLLIRARSLNIPAVLRGIAEAKNALKEFYKTDDIKKLFIRNL